MECTLHVRLMRLNLLILATYEKKKKEKEKILIHMYDNKVLDHSYREIFNSYLYWLWKNIAILYENQIEKKLET